MVPLFIAQGSKDAIVAAGVTRGFVDALCRRGAAVRFLPIEGGDHVSVGKRSADAAVAWVGDRFANRVALSSCVG